jgi:hypothetical protein
MQNISNPCKIKVVDDEIFNDSQINQSEESIDDNQIKLSKIEKYDLLK